MKRLIAGALLAGTAMSAQAADLPVKAPYLKAPAMQVYDWTGFYIGANAGGSVGRSRTTTQNPGGLIENQTTYLSAAGAIGGGQIGYNWQIPSFFNLVFGVEADIQGSGQRGSACIGFCQLDGGGTLTMQQRLDWFGTARGRVGVATGPALTYVTAGYAYGHVNTTGNLVGLPAGPGVPFGISENRGGFTIGSGVEAAIGGNWTAKLEYLYVDLGTSSASIVTAGNAAAAGFFGNPVAVSSRVRDNIFRAGVNYRIGGNSNYVAPVANWTGFYIGGNAGSLTARNQSTYSIGAGNVIGATANNQRFTLVPDGYAGGLQAGYNWQAAAWVFGIEADIQGASSKDNRSCLLACSQFGVIAYNQKVPYFGTVRGRLGYSVGSTLFYGTAGFAYGETKTTIAESAFAFGQPVSTRTLTQSKGGYAVGAGIESPLQFLGLFGPNWTTKTEYLYVDLGRTTNTFASATFGSTDTFTTRTQEHIFRTGVNYHFSSPVVARY